MIKKIFQASLVSTTVLMVGSILPSLLLSPAVAFDLGNGKTFFDKGPDLTRVTASNLSSDTPNTTYHFTVKVPQDAGEPLQAVKIVQVENLETIAFDFNQNSAFLGDSFAGGTNVSLASIGGSQPTNSNEMIVAFDPPIPPGKTVTVALKAKRNPSLGGIYQFGVTAFSPGENSPGLFLGYGRVQFLGH